MLGRVKYITLALLVVTSPGMISSGQRSAAPAAGPAHAIVPTPVSVETASGEFRMTPTTVIVVPGNNEGVSSVAKYLSTFIGLAAGPEPRGS